MGPRASLVVLIPQYLFWYVEDPPNGELVDIYFSFSFSKIYIFPSPWLWMELIAPIEPPPPSQHNNTLPCYRSMRPGCHHPNACLEAPAPSHLSTLSPAKACRQEVQARGGH